MWAGGSLPNWNLLQSFFMALCIKHRFRIFLVTIFSLFSLAASPFLMIYRAKWRKIVTHMQEIARQGTKVSFFPNDSIPRCLGLPKYLWPTRKKSLARAQKYRFFLTIPFVGAPACPKVCDLHAGNRSLGHKIFFFCLHNLVSKNKSPWHPRFVESGTPTTPILQTNHPDKLRFAILSSIQS